MLAETHGGPHLMDLGDRNECGWTADINTYISERGGIRSRRA